MLLASRYYASRFDDIATYATMPTTSRITNKIGSKSISDPVVVP